MVWCGVTIDLESHRRSHTDYCSNLAGDTSCLQQYGTGKDFLCNPNGDKMTYDYMLQNCAKFCGFTCSKYTVPILTHTCFTDTYTSYLHLHIHVVHIITCICCTYTYMLYVH